MNIISQLSAELSVPQNRIEAAVRLLDDGNTVPFISRYRKEATGGLDDSVLRNLSKRLEYLRHLEEKKAEIRSLIDAQGKLTDEISHSIDASTNVTELDDIYRPFRPKRRTRASAAKELGLEPLALLITAQKKRYSPSIEAEAEKFVSSHGKLNLTSEQAVAGACDIIAENIADDAALRRTVRTLTSEHGMLVSKKSSDNADEKGTYRQYWDYHENVKSIPSHRVLAVNRGENEECLKVSIEIDESLILNTISSSVVTDYRSPANRYIMSAVADSYSRLIAPSIEREIRNDLTDRASEDAIRNFSLNLKNLLMQAPLKGKTVMGYDPGYRTGCKLAVVTKTGSVVDTAVIYPTKPHERTAEAKAKVKELINRYSVDVIAIGNGTASAESELFIADVLKETGGKTKYVIVSEAGASVYSASELGEEEFPDYDVTERSAVSIARRLQDPLAELVKIDPKSIGVGQYQHDMKEARLDEALSGVVESCVNSVGVDLNTASYSLLSYIAGINKTTAKNIVKYRDEHGEFISRASVMKVPRFGDKAYQQAAGFLRVPGSGELLDNTGVHPESYAAAKHLMHLLGYSSASDAQGKIRTDCGRTDLKKLADEIGTGVPTLTDIIAELDKPGRDIRDSSPAPLFRDRVLEISDLEEGMIFDGTVRNVTDFGAFVDIGVHQDGLVHVSEISDTKFIKSPSDALAVGDIVKVRIKSVDVPRHRIALSMKGINS